MSNKLRVKSKEKINPKDGYTLLVGEKMYKCDWAYCEASLELGREKSKGTNSIYGVVKEKVAELMALQYSTTNECRADVEKFRQLGYKVYFTIK